MSLKAHIQDVFSVIPLTFHISKGKDDPNLTEFKKQYMQRKKSCMDNTWIIKPGENSNRGKGIYIRESLEKILKLVSSTGFHTFIVQKYIERPLLINNRKFDIRCFAMMTCINGRVQGYFYKDGYVRTSSFEYTMQSKNRFIHLTNDAIQKNSEMYGKYENSNKLSYDDLQDYFDDRNMGIKFNDYILPQIRQTVAETFCAVYKKIDVKRKQHCFELFGYDFMIDQDFKVWLIECNTNPCLEESCELLGNLLSGLIENTFNLTIDPMFPPASSTIKVSDWANEFVGENKYELLFSE